MCALGHAIPPARWGNPPPVTDHEETTGGPLGRVAGKIKEAAGSAVGNDDLAREGRLQQARVDAEREASAEAAEARQAEAEAQLEADRAQSAEERARLQTELSAAERERAAERDRRQAEQAADAQAVRESAAAEADRAHGEAAARAQEREAQRLELEAARARAAADAIDPEETPR